MGGGSRSYYYGWIIFSPLLTIAMPQMPVSARAATTLFVETRH